MAERTCITTGQTLPTHLLIRFVVAPDGYAVADLAGKLPGRGAWVKASEHSIRDAQKRGHFQRALGHDRRVIRFVRRHVHQTHQCLSLGIDVVIIT